MRTITNLDAAQHFENMMELVNGMDEVFIITSEHPDENTVLLSQTKYDNLIENAYIHQSRANVDHINHSLASLRGSVL